ncbi:MAG: methylmalonyl-CoA mutase [Candidatus Rokubacteria bacterium]|nr:methylmalonyl-CoA mutase [Candidatus Rokubacteria bacterium]
MTTPSEDPRKPDAPLTGYLDAYFEKPARLKTWSGLEVKPVYRPEDAAGDYEERLGDPGQFPYARGIHADMYRGKFWTRREVCGYGSPEDTNQRMKFLLTQGASGLNVIFDIPTMTGMDADHPMVEEEVGVQGTSLSTVEDMEALMAGLPLDGISMSIVVTSHAAPVVLAMYLAVARKRGLAPDRLRGTIQNDPLHHRFCGYPPAYSPLNLGLKTAVDCLEFCARQMPHWYPINVNAYDLREEGLGAAEEIGFSFAMARTYIDRALERGLWQFKFGVHTAGVSLVPQQPLNNIVRVAYEALAAVLGGAQSLHCCSYDEPIALPTEQAHRIAIRTQQILAYETGAGNAADPLGGSYFIEALTDRLETEARAILSRIAEQGGMYRAIETGWVDRELENAAYRYQQEVERRERIIVGSNAFIVPPERDHEVPAHPRPTVEAVHARLDRLKRFRDRRDAASVTAALLRLRDEASRGERHNLIPCLIDVVQAGVTLGEAVGVMREAYGHAWDPAGQLPSVL